MTAPTSARQVLLDLADRCEIEEPHALLDAAIHAAVFGAMDLVDDLPAYTTSLDAAVTLTDWLLISLSDIAADGMIRCELGEPGRNLVAVSVGAKTRALALCAAALRAKAEALP